MKDGRFLETCAQSQILPKLRAEGTMQIGSAVVSEPVEKFQFLQACAHSSPRKQESDRSRGADSIRIVPRVTASPDAVALADPATAYAPLTNWPTLITFHLASSAARLAAAENDRSTSRNTRIWHPEQRITSD